VKLRHREAEGLNARATLGACRIAVGQDFHTLSAAQVDLLLREADHQRYRKPTTANGSRARYFHDLLQRRAAQ